MTNEPSAGPHSTGHCRIRKNSFINKIMAKEGHQEDIIDQDKLEDDLDQAGEVDQVDLEVDTENYDNDYEDGEEDEEEEKEEEEVEYSEGEEDVLGLIFQAIYDLEDHLFLEEYEDGDGENDEQEEDEEDHEWTEEYILEMIENTSQTTSELEARGAKTRRKMKVLEQLKEKVEDDSFFDDHDSIRAAIRSRLEGLERRFWDCSKILASEKASFIKEIEDQVLPDLEDYRTETEMLKPEIENNIIEWSLCLVLYLIFNSYMCFAVSHWSPEVTHKRNLYAMVYYILHLLPVCSFPTVPLICKIWTDVIQVVESIEGLNYFENKFRKTVYSYKRDQIVQGG